ncbi:MAG: exo-alpha-sialidase, partial [Gammaproteobacteria bacterium]
MSRAVARIGVLIAFLIGLEQFAQAAGPAANQEMGGAKEPNQSNPVALQQTEGLDPTLAMDARSGTLYVAWARRASGTGTAPLEVVVA